MGAVDFYTLDFESKESKIKPYGPIKRKVAQIAHMTVFKI